VEINNYPTSPIIRGELSSEATISGTLQGVHSISGTISIPESAAAIIYDGENVVIPQVDNSIILNTENKLLKTDITVEPIPYYQTSNLSGGFTVYIGGD